MNRRLPVTLVGGFLGSGKTSLLHHFISAHHGGHLAVLVENPGALNLDAKALRGLRGAMRRSHDLVREIPTGDEAATLAWMTARLREFSETGHFERVLIEISGTSNPARLAAHFGLLPGQPETFAPWADLHQSACVVDALDFYRGLHQPPSDLVDLQHAQIREASLLVLNKCDLLPEAERQVCAARLLQLNLQAPLIEAAYGEVPPEVLSRRGTPLELGLSVETKSPITGELEGEKMERVSAPLGCALYRAYRPFHPGRFWDWFNAEHPGLWRVKGVIWLATRNLLVGGVSRTRWQNSCGAAGFWWAALPREEWPEEPEALMKMQETWREPYGDRRQELVLIGEEAQLTGSMRDQLDACLLTEEEYALPLAGWKGLPDPFPSWDLDPGE
jgi:G3E family GTPase